MSKEPIHFKQTEIGELPEGWEVKKLGEIATIKQGGRLGLTKKDYVPEGYPAFSATGQDGYVSVYEYEGEAIILSSIGAQCGKCFYATGKWTTLANTQIIFVNPEIANTLFIFYQVNRPNFWMRLGSAQPFIRPSDVKNAKVIIPPLEEQKRIAGVLRLVDRVAEETRRIVDIYERAKRFALKRLLTRGIGHTRFKQTEIGELPEGWEVKPLSDVLLDSQSGEWGKDMKEFNPDLHEPMRIIRSTEFTKDCRLLLGTAAERAIPKKKAAKILLQEGDILVERSGGGPTQPVGRVVFVEKLPEGNWGFGNFIQRLRVKPEYHPRYIWAVLFWHWLKGSVLAMQEQTTGIRNLRWSDYLNLPIPLPPLEEQKQIVEMLSTIDAAIENERRYLGVLEKCKRWLLDNLLTGKIRLSPEVDEILKGVLPDAF
jgi:type I restriction enzyme S subunit